MAKGCEGIDKPSLLDLELQIPYLFLGDKEVEVHEEVEEPHFLWGFQEAVKCFEKTLELPNDH